MHRALVGMTGLTRQAISSCRFFAAMELRDMMSIGPFDSIEIGSKSFSVS